MDRPQARHARPATSATRLPSQRPSHAGRQYSGHVFDIPTIIESLSGGRTLEPGDIISTGTPSGVGFARVPPVFLNPGDKVEGEHRGIGSLHVDIVAR